MTRKVISLVGVSLVVILLSVTGCAPNFSKSTDKTYAIDCVATNNSTVSIYVPVDANVDSESSTDMKSASEAKVTPDAISTITGGIGKVLLAP